MQTILCNFRVARPKNIRGAILLPLRRIEGIVTLNHVYATGATSLRRRLHTLTQSALRTLHQRSASEAFVYVLRGGLCEIHVVMCEFQVFWLLLFQRAPNNNFAFSVMEVDADPTEQKKVRLCERIEVQFIKQTRHWFLDVSL
jgi:hypothetical protein